MMIQNTIEKGDPILTQLSQGESLLSALVLKEKVLQQYAH